MPLRSSTLKSSKVYAFFVTKHFQGQSTNSSVFACCAVALALACSSPVAMTQQRAETASASTTHRATPRKARHVSNAQLASPAIEARVEGLLRQMTLEEKIGQLVQYNDTGDSPGAQAAGAQPAADNGAVVVA